MQTFILNLLFMVSSNMQTLSIYSICYQWFILIYAKIFSFFLEYILCHYYHKCYGEFFFRYGLSIKNSLSTIASSEIIAL